MDKVLQSALDIERKLSKMNVLVSKGASKMSVNDMVKQARKGNAIKATIKKGVKSCEVATPTEAQMNELLEILDRIVVLEETQMVFAVESKPHFDKLHCSGMVKKSLEKSEATGSAVDFAKILAEKHHPSLQAQVDELAKKETDSVKKTLAVFSNATGGEEQIDDDADDSE